MSPNALATRAFIADYLADREALEAQCVAAKDLVTVILRDANVEVHHISARLKTPSSIIVKAALKGYRNIKGQLTDLLGVRVISYYSEDVDAISDVLRMHFRIHAAKSVDKRSALAPTEFGYRSVHLIAQVSGGLGRDPRYVCLGKRWFEIQVRSLLEHAWASIDHEVVYKSRIDFPDSTLRRFASVAGTLEMLDREFAILRSEPDKVVQGHKDGYSSGRGYSARLDAARLFAILEVLFPAGLGWRGAVKRGSPFPRHIEAACLAALAKSGITTGRGLRDATQSRPFRRAMRRFAANKGIAPSDVSHLASLALVVGIRRKTLLADFLPDLLADPALTSSL